MNPPVRRAWRGALLCVVACLALFAGAAAHARAVDIAAVELSRDLFDALTIRIDPAGALTPEAIASAPGQPLSTPRALRFGYTSNTLWLQLRVRNDSAATQTRWLALGHARLEYVDLYRFDATGRHVQASWTGGAGRPLSARPIAGKESLFPVTLDPGEEAVLVLRIHGRTLTALDATLWNPIRYREHEAMQDLRLLVPAGALVAVSIYLLSSALYRRDTPFVLLALWLCSATACEFALKGYLIRFVLTGGGEWVIRAPVFFLSLSLTLAAAFIRTFLAAEGISALSKFVRGICLGGLALFLYVPFGDVQLLSITAIAGVVTLCAIYPFLLVSAWRRRHHNFGIFILALSGLWTTVMARTLVMLGILPPSAISDDTLSMVYALGVCCAATLGVVRRNIAEHEDTLRRQRALLEAQQLEQTRLEAAIAARTHALQEATLAANEANRAKSDFLARVSHDLRAPLTSILGYADLVIGSGGRQADNGRVIRRSAQHLLGLLNDLIDYARGGSRPDALQALPIYAASLLESIAAEGESLARRHHNRFEYRVDCALPAVIEVDEKRLRQILINLLDNAAKFTRDGKILFSVHCQGEHHPDEARPVVFTVEDDEPGMAPAELAHIFEPFQRLEATESHEGLGLGLAIARQWVECMNGRIEVDSAPGAGTRMHVVLPVRAASEDALSYAHQTCREDNLPELDGGGRSVWVVEDSHEIRNLLCLELRGQGFNAIPIANGHDALTLLANPATPEPDLVLTDLKMPFVSGEEVLARVGVQWPGLPVVLLTATPDAVAAHAAPAESRARPQDATPAPAGPADADGPSAQRFAAVLSKPVSLLLLRQTLAELLDLQVLSPAPPSAGQHGAALAYPDAARLAEALTLIRMGAISDLVDWADALPADNPAWADFANHARALAERGEMRQLLRLCEPASDERTPVPATGVDKTVAVPARRTVPEALPHTDLQSKAQGRGFPPEATPFP
ncbi:MAG: response regulator [Thauera sp.]|nr:response regulator [Thauera sp.]